MQTGNQLGMSSHIRSLLCLCVLLLFSLPCLGQDIGDATLHVIKPIVHAEQDVPELCLEFDHPLMDHRDNKLSAALRLTEAGTSIPVTVKMLTVTDNQLCVALPEHRANYHINFSNIRGEKGERLASPYSLSFAIPARKSDLIFVSKDSNEGWLRTAHENPVLRAINVTDVKLELFRITDPARMVEAWKQRKQTLLAPSEAATFARTNGVLVWQGNVSVKSNDDELIDQELTLERGVGSLASGLYLVVASAPDLRAKETDLAPVAATWLQRSTVRSYAFYGDRGLHLVTEDSDATTPLKGAHFALMDAKQKVMTSGAVDDNGIAYVELSEADRTQADTLLVQTDAGDIDFVDTTEGVKSAIVLPNKHAEIETDKAFYAPGESLSITLRMRDMHATQIAFTQGQLDLLAADRSVYSSTSVSASNNGITNIAIFAPLKEGLWSFVWRQADGTVLAEIPLRISHNIDAPVVSFVANQSSLSRDGDANVTLQSRHLSGEVSPFIMGQVVSSWVPATHIFPGWEDYTFGVADSSAVDTKPEVATHFMTGADGQAHLRFKANIPVSTSALYALKLKCVSDKITGAVCEQGMSLPLKPKNSVVGIKSIQPDGNFSENSIAEFSVVSLNQDGNPAHRDDLSYQIYEVGRHFDWFQLEGSWQYKLQPQQRLVGGDAITFSSDGTADLQWPVTAGSYRLDIIDGDGKLVASRDFNAGWYRQNMASISTPLLLTPSEHVFTVGKTGRVLFTLDQPALVTAIVSDDHIRKIIHAAMPAGKNTFDIQPTSEWGDNIVVNLFVHTTSDNKEHIASGRIVVPLISAAVAAKDQPHVQKQSNNNAASADTEHVIPAFYRDDFSIQKNTTSIVQPKQTYNSPNTKVDATKGSEKLTLLSTEPIPNFLSILESAIDAPLFSTQDICDWLKIVRLWQDVIIDAKIMPASIVNAKKEQLLQIVASRQLPDGSFSLAEGGDGAVPLTAQVVIELSSNKIPTLQPVYDHAVSWLKHRLDNTWFDESDRVNRVDAYAALAAAGQMDSASLHYFSDSSIDKQLPPAACLKLSVLFSKIGDGKKAQEWVNAAHIDSLADPEFETIPLLIAGEKRDVSRYVPSLQKLSDKVLSDNLSLHDKSWILQAMNDLLDHSAEWHVTVNGGERSGKNIGVINLSTQTAPIVIKNIGNNALVVTSVDLKKDAANPNKITRHIYRPDGGEIKDNVVKGGVYVVVLESAQSIRSGASLTLQDDISPGLRPISCPLQGAQGNSVLIWLPPLTTVDACDTLGSGLQILIAPKINLTGWRIAYLVQAVQSKVPKLPHD
jgi:uncharacterized protein YfaS (alpha-2-macroglobulin family)